MKAVTVTAEPEKTSGKRKRFIIGNVNSGVSGSLYIKDDVEVDQVIILFKAPAKEDI